MFVPALYFLNKGLMRVPFSPRRLITIIALPYNNYLDSIIIRTSPGPSLLHAGSWFIKAWIHWFYLKSSTEEERVTERKNETLFVFILTNTLNLKPM